MSDKKYLTLGRYINKYSYHTMYAAKHTPNTDNLWYLCFWGLSATINSQDVADLAIKPLLESGIKCSAARKNEWSYYIIFETLEDEANAIEKFGKNYDEIADITWETYFACSGNTKEDWAIRYPDFVEKHPNLFKDSPIDTPENPI